MKKVLAAFTFAAIIALLSGCETVEGFGRDLGKLGGSIEDAADKNN